MCQVESTSESDPYSTGCLCPRNVPACFAESTPPAIRPISICAHSYASRMRFFPQVCEVPSWTWTRCSCMHSKLRFPSQLPQCRLRSCRRDFYLQPHEGRYGRGGQAPVQRGPWWPWALGPTLRHLLDHTTESASKRPLVWKITLASTPPILHMHQGGLIAWHSLHMVPQRADNHQ